MFTSVHPEHDLSQIRERHSHLRRQAEVSRLARANRHRHRYRSRRRT